MAAVAAPIAAAALVTVAAALGVRPAVFDTPVSGIAATPGCLPPTDAKYHAGKTKFAEFVLHKNWDPVYAYNFLEIDGATREGTF